MDWKTARTVADLGRLTADWLEGRGDRFPGYGDTCPDDETRELIPALAALNRSGFLTDNSQPGSYGRGSDGRIWKQLPFVSGFVATDRSRTVKEIQRQCRRAGLVVVIDGRRDDRRPGGIPVVYAGGDVCASAGTKASERQLRHVWGAEAPSAVAAVVSAYQVTVMDLGGERRTRMWSLLDQVVRR